MHDLHGTVLEHSNLDARTWLWVTGDSITLEEHLEWLDAGKENGQALAHILRVVRYRLSPYAMAFKYSTASPV